MQDAWQHWKQNTICKRLEHRRERVIDWLSKNMLERSRRTWIEQVTSNKKIILESTDSGLTLHQLRIPLCGTLSYPCCYFNWFELDICGQLLYIAFLQLHVLHIYFLLLYIMQVSSSLVHFKHVQIVVRSNSSYIWRCI